MRRKFNITGSCNPKRHYMVQLDDRLKKIRENYIDDGCYFVINRGRQYGKTTTLNRLEEYLKDDYLVLSLDFQLMGTEAFSDETSFSPAFSGDIITALKNTKTAGVEALISELTKPETSALYYGLKELFVNLSNMCRKSQVPIVLMIDVDSASNNQVFIDLLAQLRGYYLRREKTPIFHSVVLVIRPNQEHAGGI